MKFIFSETVPASFEGPYVSYSFEEPNGRGLQYVDVRSFIHQHQDELLASIDKWHGEVCRKGQAVVDYWWLNPASRQLSWYPAIFQPLLFSIGICELIKGLSPAHQELLVLRAPSEVITYLREFSPEATFEVLGSRGFPRFYFLETVKAYLSFLRSHLRGVMCFTPRIPTKDLLVFSQVLNADSLANGSDHFFGSLFFKVDKARREKTHWLMFYPENKSRLKKRLRQIFESQGSAISFTHDFLSGFDFLRIIFLSLRNKLQILRLGKDLPPFVTLHYQSITFPEVYREKVLSHGQEILMELEVAFAMRRLSDKQGFKRLIYPYEERSIERAVLLSTPQFIKTYGFAHAAMHQGHICFNMRRELDSNPPRPHCVLVTGEAPKSWFLEKGFSVESLKIIGSPRAAQTPLPKTDSVGPANKVLVMISHPHELQILNNLMEKDSSVLGQMEVTIRKYPYSGLDEQNRWITRLSKYVPKLKDEGGDLPTQIRSHDIVIFSASSGGIEAILLGAVGLYVSLDKLMLLNPIEVLKNQIDIPQSFSIDELNRNLKYLSSLTRSQLQELQKKQVLLVRKIYQEPNIDSLYDQL